MKRRHFIQLLAALPLVPRIAGAADADTALLGTLRKPAGFWKTLVSPAAYGVLFHEDTEAPNSSPLNNEHREGTFTCAACYNPLFKSAMKFDSGTGWPSFFTVLPDAVATRVDHRLIFETRTEYHCARCGGHQGHRFDDGPQPTGLRYCNNGLALHFVPATETLPAPRG
ncbi:MAG TPA: peptide-methionine (R)-S-oxide reductase MsrB [Stenotrophobium sp.]|jgi:peptide-methionine (R)-S-oxide reductase|nr:peptide-methionine (R)-S-oxide reductase MsrB [Stenotrophobium sp.]